MTHEAPEEILVVDDNADNRRLLRRILRRRGYEVAPIAIGTSTDPYQPLEAKMGVMRGLLEVLSAHNHPVTRITTAPMTTPAEISAS